MNTRLAAILRHIAQHHIDIHPVWSKEAREVMRVFFDLDEKELDAIQAMLDWISCHGLERYCT